MVILSASLSFSLISLLSVLMLMVFRDARHLIQGKLFIALSLCFILLTLVTLPLEVKPSGWFYWLARLLACLNVGFIWWFCLSLLKDDFKLFWFEWLGFIFLTLLPLAYALYDFGFKFISVDFLNNLRGFPSLLMVAHVVWIAIKGKNNDLVETRRSARNWLVMALALASFLSILSESYSNIMPEQLLRPLLALPIILFTILWLSRVNPEALIFETKSFKQQKESSGEPKILAKDYDLFKKLQNAMDEQEIYKEVNLTVNQLSKHLGCKEHQLRALINTGLGHRNFSSFLAGYRLKLAKSILAEPANSRMPMIQVSEKSGFASLQTFNRIFKKQEQCSPTEFRKQALEKRTQN